MNFKEIMKVNINEKQESTGRVSRPLQRDVRQHFYKINEYSKSYFSGSLSELSELLDNKPEDVSGYNLAEINFAFEIYKESATSFEFVRKIKAQYKYASVRDYMLMWQAFNMVYMNELFVG